MITLTTTLYDGNYEQFLTEKHNNWFFTFNNKKVTKKLLVINNLTNKELFLNLLQSVSEKYDQQIDYIIVDEYSDDARKHFNLQIDKNSLGYYYSMQYFVMFLKVTTPYIFNVSTDCMVDINVEDNFFDKSIELFKSSDYPVSFIPWSKHWKTYGYPDEIGVRDDVSCVAEWEQIHSIKFPETEFPDGFWCAHVTSDQVFFGDVEKLKNIDYNTSMGSCYLHSRAPYAGDNAFEVRLSDYLFYKKLYKVVLKTETQYYIHSGAIPGLNIK